MKRNIFWALVLSLSFASLAHGQAIATAAPVVMGQGTPNYVPIWTGHNTIGNSVLFQSDGNIGVGTTSPQATLDVESNETNRTGIYGRSASPSGSGVVGDETATSGTTNGVFGRSASPNGIGVSGDATATTGSAFGVLGQTNATGYGAGVLGAANATTGTAFGVYGSTNSPNGNGVFGVC